MRYGSGKRGRRSIRLKEYDYTQPGAYFVTICTEGGRCVFGEIANAEMQLNDAGRMIKTVWDELPKRYGGVSMDAFAVMPNHVHGVVLLKDTRDGRRQGMTFTPNDGQPRGVAPTEDHAGEQGIDCAAVDGEKGKGRRAAMSLSDVVARFKSLTTKQYREGAEREAWPRFVGRLWQRNYYEHVIRSDEELNGVREYISANPMRWGMDGENPEGPHGRDRQP